MRNEAFEILSNRPVARDRFELRLAGCTDGICPGQFVELKAEGFFLRRPFSVCDAEDGVLTVVYHVLGEGTGALSRRSGGTLDVLCGLGNGFDLSCAGERPLLIAGGTGLTPLYFLAKELKKAGHEPRLIMGFAARDDVFYFDRLHALGIEPVVMTADGSAGRRGFVTEAMDERPYTQIYSCGPLAMLAAVAAKAKSPAQFSLEARMGCGFGACMGCTIETKYGARRVCRDGPVFRAEELIW